MKVMIMKKIILMVPVIRLKFELVYCIIVISLVYKRST